MKQSVKPQKYTDLGRRYPWPPVKEPEYILPSVTTITGNLDKSDPLMGFAARETATYAVDKILDWEGKPREEAIQEIKTEHFKISNAAKKKGTKVHQAIEVAIAASQDEEPTTHPDLLPYVASALQFLEEHVDKVGITEASFYNLTHGYAGTTDAMVKLKDGRYAIVDWKSGKGLYPETALQLAAYARCEFIGFSDGSKVNLDKPITAGVGVHVKDDGTYEAYFCDITDDIYRTFRALREVQRWKDEIESAVWQQTIRSRTTQKEAS